MLKKYGKGVNKLRKTAVFKNSVWSIAEVLIFPVLMFVATPVFLHRLGPENYGIWAVVNIIIAGMSVLNVGMADATIRFVSKYRGLDDKVKVAKVVNTTYSVYMILACIAAVIGWGITVGIENFQYDFIDYASRNFNLKYKIREDHMATIIPALKIASVTFGLRFVEQIFLAVFKGFERYDFASQMGIVSKLLILVLNLVWVLTGHGLIYILSSSAIVTLITVSIESLVIKRFLPGFGIIPMIDKATFREVSGYSVYGWLQSVLSIFSRQSDKLVVTFIGGFTVVAYYTTAFNVMSQIHALFVAATSWVFPAVSRKQEKNEDLARFYYSMQVLISGGGLFGIISLYLIREFFLTAWLGPVDYRKTVPYMEAFMCYGTMIVGTIVPYFFINGSGKIKITSKFTVIMLFIQTATMIIMFRFLGTIGLAWALVVTNIIVQPFFYAILSKSVLKEKSLFPAVLFPLPALFFIGFCLTNVIWLEALFFMAIPVSFKYIYFNKADLKASLSFLKH
ncbi:MAG: oligosaccharide flippase family protein [Bacteroidota bacterium]